MASKIDHDQWMQRALDLAELGSGHVSPNPRVGCVITDGESILAEGWHERYGGPHAEVNALNELRSTPTDATTLYVTLEPCAHHGKTPPCTDAIIASGIKRVVIATLDVNPEVSGKGVAALRAAGIEVEIGVLEDKAVTMNRWFFKHITTGAPYVILKMAQSIDGVIAPIPLREKPLTGNATKLLVHTLRSEVDAVMVGVNTVVVDDPRLTVRDIEGRDPIRIVVDPEAELPADSWFVKNAGIVRSIAIVSEQCLNDDALSKMRELGVEIITTTEADGRLDLNDALSQLGGSGVASILCEGGSFLASSLIEDDLVDELRIHIAPVIIGQGLRFEVDLETSFELSATHRSDDDVLLSYHPIRS